MNKKGSNVIYGLLPLIIVFSLASMIGVLISFIFFGVYNDYIFYNLQEISEQLESDGTIDEMYSELTLDSFLGFQKLANRVDDWWFGFWMIFIASTLFYAYRTRELNDFSLFTFIFYGILVFMFLVGLFGVLTEWLKINFLDKILPQGYLVLKKFSFYIANIGVINLGHSLLCLFVNKSDFNFDKSFQRKKKEMRALEDNEVL